MSGGVILVDLEGYPQTSSNRTRAQATSRIAGYAGGAGDPEVEAQAGEALDDAVDAFNEWLWMFNIVEQDITLTNDTSDYLLTSNFYKPKIAIALDSNNKTRYPRLRWIEWENFRMRRGDQSTGSNYPLIYTARNVHATGMMTFDPRPLSPFQYPKVHVEYFKRIEKTVAPGEYLNVPREVDLAIFRLAVANFLEAKDKPSELAFTRAEKAKWAVALQHRGFADYQR